MNLNYFQLLEIDPSFEINKQELSNKFKHKAFQFHPDNNKDINATLIYANLNEAYQNLISNSKRAFHLLKLQNVKFDEEQSMHDFDFLESQLQWQEYLENANSIEQLEKLQEDLENNIQMYFNEFNDTFSVDAAFKLQFLEKLEMRINQKFQDIE